MTVFGYRPFKNIPQLQINSFARNSISNYLYLRTHEVSVHESLASMTFCHTISKKNFKVKKIQANPFLKTANDSGRSFPKFTWSLKYWIYPTTIKFIHLKVLCFLLYFENELSTDSVRLEQVIVHLIGKPNVQFPI